MASDPWAKKKGVYNFLKKPDEQTYTPASGDSVATGGQNYYQNSDAELKPLNQIVNEPERAQNYFDAKANDPINFETASGPSDYSWSDQPGQRNTDKVNTFDPVSMFNIPDAAKNTFASNPTMLQPWSERIKSIINPNVSPLNDKTTFGIPQEARGSFLDNRGADLNKILPTSIMTNRQRLNSIPLGFMQGIQDIVPGLKGAMESYSGIPEKDFAARFVGARPGEYNPSIGEQALTGISRFGANALAYEMLPSLLPAKIAQGASKIANPVGNFLATSAIRNAPFATAIGASEYAYTGDPMKGAKEAAINLALPVAFEGALKGVPAAYKYMNSNPINRAVDDVLETIKPQNFDGVDYGTKLDRTSPTTLNGRYSIAGSKEIYGPVDATSPSGKYSLRQPDYQSPRTVQEPYKPSSPSGKYGIKNTRLDELQTEYDNIITELQNKYGTNELRASEMQNEPALRRLNQLLKEMDYQEKLKPTDLMLDATERARNSRAAGVSNRGTDILEGRSIETPIIPKTREDITRPEGVTNRVADILLGKKQQIPKSRADFTPNTDKFGKKKAPSATLPQDKDTLVQLKTNLENDVRNGLEVNPQLFAQIVEQIDDPINKAPTAPPQVLTAEQVKQRNNAARPGFFDRLYNNFFDNQSGFDNLEKAINPTGDKVSVKALGSNARKSGGISRYILNDNLIDQNGETIGKSFKSIVDAIPENLRDDFELYQLHRHNVDRLQIRDTAKIAEIEGKVSALEKQKAAQIAKDSTSVLGKEKIASLDNQIAKAKEATGNVKFKEKPVFGDDVSAEDSVNIMRAYEEAHPEFKQLGDDWNKFINDFNQEWRVNSGLLDQESYNLMKEMYPNYVPTARYFSEMEKVKQFDSASNKFVNNNSGIKTATGSGRDILSPLDTTMSMVDKTVRTAQYNKVGQELVTQLRNDPRGLADYAEIVPTKQSVIDDINKYLEDGDLEGMSTELLNQFDKALSKLKGDNIVTVMEKGVPVQIRINDPMLLKTLIGMSDNSGAIGQGARKFMSPLKNLITTYNPLFAARNVMRDLPTAYVQGQESNPIKFMANNLSAAKDIMKNDPLFQRYKALGGGESNFFKSDVTKLMDSGSKWEKTKNSIGYLNFITETMPRYAEFKSTYTKAIADGMQEGKALQKALFNSAEVTVDFTRGGDITKSADAFVMYLNASVQGIDKFARTAKNKPLAALTKSALSTTVPASLLYQLNKDDPNYQKLDNRTKDANFLIPTFDMDGNKTGEFFKVPKNREYGTVMGAFAERLWRYANGEKDAFKDLGNQFKSNFLPANPADSSLVSPFYQLATNKDFAGRTILSQGLDKGSKSGQYDEKTSEVSIALAKGINAIAGLINKDLGIAPKQLEHLIKSYTGVIGQFGIPLTTADTYRTEGNPLSSAASTLGRSFIADPTYNNDLLNQVYEQKKTLEDQKTDAKRNNEEFSDLDTQKLKRLSAFTEVSGNIYDQIKAATSTEEQKSLRKLLNDMSEATLKKIDTETEFIPPQLPDKFNINKEEQIIPAGDYMKYQDRLDTNAREVYDYIKNDPTFDTLAPEDQQKVMDTAMTDVSTAIKNIYADDNGIDNKKERTTEEAAISKLKGQLRDKYNVSVDDLFDYGTHQQLIIKDDPLYEDLKKVQSGGVDRNTALGIVREWEGLKPLEGKTTVSEKQKRQTLYNNNSLSEDQKQKIFKAFLFTPDASQKKKLDAAEAQGVSRDTTMEMMRILSDLESGRVSATTGNAIAASPAQRKAAIMNSGLSKKDADILYRLYYPKG